MEHAGVDRLNALYSAIDIVRRGGTISLSGVYGGAADPMALMTISRAMVLRAPKAWPTWMITYSSTIGTTRKARSMATPPRVGVGRRWIRRSSGRTTAPSRTASRHTAGVAR